MRRRIAQFMALLLCVALLAGCGKGEVNIAGKTTPLNEQKDAAAPTAKPEPTAAPSEEPTVEPKPEPSVEADVETEEHKLSLGRVEGGTYENSYAGIGCKLDANWEFYTAEELQELPQNVYDALLEEELADELLENYPQIIDMMAQNEEMLETLQVVFSKMSLENRIAYSMVSEEEVLDAVLAETGMIDELWSQSEATLKSIEKKEVIFLGEPHAALYTTADLYGYPFYSLQIMDHSRGAYRVTVTMSSVMEDRTEEMLGLFYKVE